MIINHENYFINSDGYLMPTQKGQRKPDLKFFEN